MAQTGLKSGFERLSPRLKFSTTYQGPFKTFFRGGYLFLFAPKFSANHLSSSKTNLDGSHTQTWCKHIDEDDNYSRSSDEHSPNHVRVWGTLTNSKEFAEAWQCEAGSPMNPVHDKCEMW